MTSLRDMQAAVLDALLEDRLEAAAPYLSNPDPRSAARLKVYRSNFVTNFLNALRSTYPVIERLVGTNYFRQIVADFQGKSPSRSGDLADAGLEFPNYLHHLHGGDRFRYLSDVAQLEWLIQESSLAAHHAPFAMERLARVEPHDYEELRFVLHPTLRIFTSPYPVLAIWESNVAGLNEPAMNTPDVAAPRGVEPDREHGSGPGEVEVGAIDLDRGPNRVAILRPRLQLQFLQMNAGECAFLRAIGAGARFAATIECGHAAAAEFDASAALRRFVTAQAIVDVESNAAQR